MGPLKRLFIDKRLCAISGPPTTRAEVTIHLPTPATSLYRQPEPAALAALAVPAAVPSLPGPSRPHLARTVSSTEPA